MWLTAVPGNETACFVTDTVTARQEMRHHVLWLTARQEMKHHVLWLIAVPGDETECFVADS